MGEDLRMPDDFDLRDVAFAELGRGVARVVLGDGVVGGRGGVAQRHVGLALEEEAVALGPAARHGEDVRLEAGPDFGGAVAIGLP